MSSDARDATATSLSPKATRTRARLVDAATALFEQKGFLETSVHDIVTAAGLAYGTFYVYFPSKEALFESVIAELLERFRAIAAAEPRTGSDPASLIERANRGYLRAYRETAALQRVMEEVSLINPRLGRELRDANRYWRERARRAITGWQIDGLVDREIDAVYAANMLGVMVDRSAYLWFVLGEPHDFDAAVEHLTHLYCNALGIRRPRASDSTGPEDD